MHNCYLKSLEVLDVVLIGRFIIHKHFQQEMSLKKTGRKIERNANLILYFNASLFIYKVTESQFEHN